MKISSLEKNKKYRRPDYPKGAYIIFVDNYCYYYWYHKICDDKKELLNVEFKIKHSDIQATDYEEIKE